jgi:putative nucleotidyltransferase with HDIG domain
MLKRIATKDVRMGMYINEFCGSWMDHPFWRSRFLLETEEDLKSIHASAIKELWIDTSKGLDVDASVAAVTEEQASEEADALLDSLDQDGASSSMDLGAEIHKARKLHAHARSAVINMFDNVRMGRALNTEHANILVEEIASSVSRHPHAFISLARLKNADEYTYLHCVAVCGLMIALARQLRLPEEQVREAGMAGLFHDLGKMGISDSILNKPGKLTREEFSVMQKHSEMGAALLSKSGQVSDLVIDVCLHHHEKVDGSGYPHRLKDEEISLFAKMGAVCDVYDAISSDRPYKKGWLPAESIHKMAEWSRGHFDQRIFQAFVKTLGIYPTGSLVQLASGHLAVVLEQNPNSLLTPRVKIFYSIRTRSAIPPQILDLSKLVGKNKIISRESAEDWGLRNLESLWLG